MAGGHPSHSDHDNGSTADARTVARHRTPSQAMTCFLGGATSVSPRSIGQHRAQGSTMVKQACRQASGHHGPAKRGTMTQAHGQGGEDPNGGPRHHLSSGHALGYVTPRSVDGVDMLHRQLGEIIAITTAQLEECARWCQIGGSTSSPDRPRAEWKKAMTEPSVSDSNVVP
jgi:hypothetical protein